MPAAIDAAGIVMMFECMRAFQQVLALMAASMNMEEAIKRYDGPSLARRGKKD
jgi:H+/Cl- antiporter ClcA